MTDTRHGYRVTHPSVSNVPGDRKPGTVIGPIHATEEAAGRAASAAVDRYRGKTMQVWRADADGNPTTLAMEVATSGSSYFADPSFRFDFTVPA